MDVRPGFADRTPFIGTTTAEGKNMPFKDPEKERACARRRYKRITAERIDRGMCPRCGKAKPVPDRTLCRPCVDKRRRAERARHAKAKAAGMLYAGRDAERCRRSASDRSKRRNRARREAGLCTRCGKQQPVECQSASKIDPLSACNIDPLSARRRLSL